MQKSFERLKILYKRFEKTEIQTRAAALAYHTLLGIVPIAGLFIWYLTTIGVTGDWLAEAKRFLLAQLNMGSSEAFLTYFETFTTNVRGNSWGWVGLVLLAYTAWNLIDAFGTALDTIMGTASHPPETALSFVATNLRRLLVMLSLPIALTVTLVATHWIQKDSWLKHLFNLRAVGPVFALPLAWSASVLAFFLVYTLVPRKPAPVLQCLKAAAIVAVASEILRIGFGVYTRYAVSSEKIYGVLAAVPMFILWVQLSWLVILCGALFIAYRKPVILPP